MWTIILIVLLAAVFAMFTYDIRVQGSKLNKARVHLNAVILERNAAVSEVKKLRKELEQEKLFHQTAISALTPKRDKRTGQFVRREK